MVRKVCPSLSKEVGVGELLRKGLRPGHPDGPQVGEVQHPAQLLGTHLTTSKSFQGAPAQSGGGSQPISSAPHLPSGRWHEANSRLSDPENFSQMILWWFLPFIFSALSYLSQRLDTVFWVLQWSYIFLLISFCLFTLLCGKFPKLYFPSFLLMF